MRDYRETFRQCKHTGTAMEGGIEEIQTAFSGSFYGKLYTCAYTKQPCTSKECPKLAQMRTGELDDIGLLKGGKLD